MVRRLCNTCLNVNVLEILGDIAQLMLVKVGDKLIAAKHALSEKVPVRIILFRCKHRATVEYGGAYCRICQDARHEATASRRDWRCSATCVCLCESVS